MFAKPEGDNNYACIAPECCIPFITCFDYFEHVLKNVYDMIWGKGNVRNHFAGGQYQT